ncbi:MAG: potassium channel family protein [Verrucomicrobiota bacterium]
MTALSAPSARRRFRFGTRRYSSVELLATLILLFAVTPFIEDLPYGDLIEMCIMSLVLIAAMFAVGGRRQTLVVSAALLGPALLGKWLAHLLPHLVPPHFFLGFGIAFVALVVVNLLRFILRASQVDTEVLCAGISAYLMLGLLWALAYVWVARVTPDAFAFSAGTDHTMDSFNGFYLSFVTLSTLGFGDVTPVSKLARTLTVMEAVSGTFFVTVLIARLVAMYSPSQGVSSDSP